MTKLQLECVRSYLRIDNTAQYICCKVPIGFDEFVVAFTKADRSNNDTIYILEDDKKQKFLRFMNSKHNINFFGLSSNNITVVEPFIQAKVIGKCRCVETNMQNYLRGGRIKHYYLSIEITVDGLVGTVNMKVDEPIRRGKGFIELKQDAICFSTKIDFFDSLVVKQKTIRVGKWANLGRLYYDDYRDDEFGRGYMNAMWFIINNYGINRDKVVELFFQHAVTQKRTIPTKGVKGLEKRKNVAAMLKKLSLEQPTLYNYYLHLHDEKNVKHISNNFLLSAFLTEVNGDYNKLYEALKNSCDQFIALPKGPNSKDDVVLRDICLNLPGAKEKGIEKRAETEWNLRATLTEQSAGLGITKELYPKLYKAIVEDKKIPLSIFHEPGDCNNVINVEFSLLEKALKRPGWGDVICEIATNAAKRKMYEKNITPYISFLFKIEKYLAKNTKGKKWTAIPKYIKSQWELEMDESSEEGTTKRRSALTPVADNENNTITVPYASMAIRGIQTTYCYALNYYVFEENWIDPETKTPIINELEKKLNGRDDYGLMYYTLTGTSKNTGYPTFLIIFERLQAKTRVHFHRVHPSRMKNGIKVPSCRLIKECYRYMAGNIKAEEIYAQQGDLIFIKTDSDVNLDEAKPVKEFEHHSFISPKDTPVVLVPNKSKTIKNRLGFISSSQPFKVDHPEHDPLEEIPPGTYEVRRAKSWEANPTAVWVLTID